MRIGIPTEIKSQENRVAITPAGVHHLAQAGHEVLVQEGAGLGSGISDADYTGAGARIIKQAADVWGDAELLIKVKEPIAAEYPYLREDQVVFTYLHLAADKEQTDALLESRTTSIAYETVQTASGALPLLSPMSEVAGRMSALVGANALMKHFGGKGIQVSGVPGTRPAKAVVIGAGVAGQNAAQMLYGMRADVTIFDVNLARLGQLDSEFGGHAKTLYSTQYAIARELADADIVIGSVLIPGARAPKLVTHDMMVGAQPGTVFVDIAVDQGGCFEDTHPTTHADPVFQVGQSILYAVANMPGALPVTSTYALTNATLAYATQIANKGWKRALRENPVLARGLATHAGHLTSAPVAEAWGYESVSVDYALAA
ncbi:MAG: alanine dehydrogenase [Propionibacteriaceae bacterium]|jgi:alanine dehydrogenase|nr:alanine dehydrogenase [Propionibacteriaceae bacterium]